MWVTLSEIEATSLKAARSAGYSWGMAEEAGKAVRSLTLQGLPWLRPLVTGVLRPISRLESLESARLAGTAYGPTDSGRMLGPVSVLTALADEVVPLPAAGSELAFRNLAAPVMLLPTLAILAKRSGCSLLVRWPGALVECGGGEVRIEPGAKLGLHAVATEWFTISRLRSDGTGPRPVSSLRHQGCVVEMDLWRELKGLANRGYIPEIETTRLHGGASLTDKD